MTASEDPANLLEMLRAKYGVDEGDQLLGPCITVPNSQFKREWAQTLQQAGIHMYCGEREGRVAWVIPLKPRKGSALPFDKPLINGLPLNSQLPQKNPGNLQAPCSDDPLPSTSTPRPAESNQPSRGCITGPAWTSLEDQQLLAMLSQGKHVREIARELSAKLDRTEEAVKSRVLKLKQRLTKETTLERAVEKPVDTSLETKGSGGFEPSGPELASLLESALLLAGDPKHKPALRIILEACLRLATPNQTS